LKYPIKWGSRWIDSRVPRENGIPSVRGGSILGVFGVKKDPFWGSFWDPFLDPFLTPFYGVSEIPHKMGLPLDRSGVYLVFLNPPVPGEVKKRG
jgi:hypothetical protein